jgi:hypothetical protein
MYKDFITNEGVDVEFVTVIALIFVIIINVIISPGCEETAESYEAISYQYTV